jgi:hypothetical protein
VPVAASLRALDLLLLLRNLSLQDGEGSLEI